MEHLRKDPEFVAAHEELRPLFEIADDVIGLRLERGWTQTELAQRAGTYQYKVSRLENALDNPTVESLRKLAAALDTQLEIRPRPERERAPEATLAFRVAETGSRFVVLEMPGEKVLILIFKCEDGEWTGATDLYMTLGGAGALQGVLADYLAAHRERLAVGDVEG